MQASAPEKIAGGFGFTEGPVFSRRGYLLFSDMTPNRIMKWEHGKVTVFRENSNGANQAAAGLVSALLVARFRGIVVERYFSSLLLFIIWLCEGKRTTD